MSRRGSFGNDLGFLRRKFVGFSACIVVRMNWILLRIDFSRLFWVLFGLFSYENHEGKPRI